MPVGGDHSDVATFSLLDGDAVQAVTRFIRGHGKKRALDHLAQPGKSPSARRMKSATLSLLTNPKVNGISRSKIANVEPSRRKVPYTSVSDLPPNRAVPAARRSSRTLNL
jgi:hypothetical protein